MKKLGVVAVCLLALPLGARAQSEEEAGELIATQAFEVSRDVQVAINSVQNRAGNPATCLYLGSLFKDVMALSRMLRLASPEIQKKVGQTVSQLYVQSQVVHGFCGIGGGDMASGGGIVLPWLKKGDKKTLLDQLNWMKIRTDSLMKGLEE